MRDTSRPHAPQPRGDRIDTRFGEDEYRRVRKVSKWRQQPPSVFVREAVMAAVVAAEGRWAVSDESAEPAAPMVTAQQLAELHAARVEVKRVGTNLNQLVRLANRGQIDLGDLRPVIEELRTMIDNMVAQLGGSTSP
ncbi:MAG: MobC family plasmid mobilization relaxosome protein [Propionibacteriaceae bacterium]|nr:MobC family plasmid mobilization relaxosome protein [Propionibacteriaceae bacterium]